MKAAASVERPPPEASIPGITPDAAPPACIAYLKDTDVAAFQRAYQFAERAHSGQLRKDGKPYITHPLAVAEILAEWQLDAQTLIAALLHDVVEDTGVSTSEIAQEFGKAVAGLVDGVTKLDKIQFENKAQAQAENFRKMLLAMARDVRVILIKLADRLHNMRTLDAMRPDQQGRIAQETLDIYAPIANRLGLNHLYQELEDLAFQHLHPNRYKVIEKAVKAARGNRSEVVDKIRAAIEAKLATCQIPAHIYGREKHLYSVYRKMQEKHLAFSEVFDIYGFRVIVEDARACYVALGALHALYKPIPGKFKDYLAIPKPNGYQSLHTTLFGPFGAPVEVQIRTQEMHRIAEAGVASHWLYKAGENTISELQIQTNQWLQSLLDIQADSRDSVEFLEHIKFDLFPDEVYVFTPKGRIVALPRGATAVDFAYSVHSDVGNHCVGVKINGEFMPLSTPLKNGDRVEVLTSESARPNPAWAHFAITGKARAHIRSALKSTHRHESILLGERLLDQAVRALGSEPDSLGTAQWERFQKENGRDRDDTLADIGLGKRLAFVVARQVLAKEADALLGKSTGPMPIRGAEGVVVRLGKCCRPIPGDPIIGQIKKEQGLIIHTHDCPQVRHYREDPDKWVDVAWAAQLDKLFEVGIRIIVANQRGVLAKVAAAIASEGADIDNVRMEEEADAYTSLYFTVSVQNRLHLARLMRALRSLHEVIRIQRMKGKGEERGVNVV
ncbi:MAG: bifunctional (p)ppGpp synthetase/guanosine-3',5'-bis(diphosphate) 3'-pyrophosphohydrolase [Pseudomonadota bacterium]|nr:bifunctional (p)ppGpp synthetase/guanosine-3',5'-bis(diphosphate) 3'-pyrophosphohydrolase [Pseudomonadota bacterium]